MHTHLEPKGNTKKERARAPGSARCGTTCRRGRTATRRPHACRVGQAGPARTLLGPWSAPGPAATRVTAGGAEYSVLLLASLVLAMHHLACTSSLVLAMHQPPRELGTCHAPLDMHQQLGTCHAPASSRAQYLSCTSSCGRQQQGWARASHPYGLLSVDVRQAGRGAMAQGSWHVAHTCVQRPGGGCWAAARVASQCRAQPGIWPGRGEKACLSKELAGLRRMGGPVHGQVHPLSPFLHLKRGPLRDMLPPLHVFTLFRRVSRG